MSVKAPLIATLKTEKLELVREVELDLDRFPEMIELITRREVTEDLPTPLDIIVGSNNTVRRFFREGITDRRGYYREGVSHRIEG